jgi:cephalosporin-C deacetylase
MPPFQHSFPFDPSYGYTLETLLEVQPPPAPANFLAFWQARYARLLEVQTKPEFRLCKPPSPDMQLYMIRYLSTGGFRIGGWLLKPKYGPLERGVVVGHGYGGRDGPDLNLPFPRAALLFPCFRGLSLSKRPPISSDPNFHVLHDIDKTNQYILGGCVEDLWLAVSTLQNLFPELEGHIGYMGRSFGGGIGALALAVETRVARAHLCVPTFGNQPLRLTLPTQGSGEAVRNYAKRHGDVMQTLQYYDAATAARHIKVPMHIAAALFDPVVAPPGQFSIYNALPTAKTLKTLEAGHFDFPGLQQQETALLEGVRTFFEAL